MPELPEVETVRLALDKRIKGKTIAAIIHARPDYVRIGGELAETFNHGKITGIERRGKCLGIHADNGLTLFHHLGMSGRLLLENASEPAGQHCHVRLKLDQGKLELRQRDPRRFGYFGLCETAGIEEIPFWSGMGPDPFIIQPSEFHERIHCRKRAIKTVLLDQKIIAGLGNIYADESLFRAGIHPQRLACEIRPAQSKKLIAIIQAVLTQAIAAGGTSTNDYRKLDGTFGDFQNWLRVYGRDGEPCAECGCAIQRIALGGRSARFCPSCQK